MIWPADASPPPSMVPADDELFPPVVHSWLWLAAGLGAVAVAVALLVWCWWIAPARERAVASRSVPTTERYLAELDELGRRFAGGELDERELHHQLGRAVRRFAADRGVDGALAMTPRDLREVGCRPIADVVAGYQPPQFMQRPVSDPARSLDRARALVDALPDRRGEVGP